MSPVVTTLNHDSILKDQPILSKVKWAHVIIDEGHRMKNSYYNLSSTLSQYYVNRYRSILTDTSSSVSSPI